MSEHDKSTVVVMFSVCLFVALLALAKVTDGDGQSVIYIMQAVIAGVGLWNGWKAINNWNGE